jgi:hypothetical protein
LAERQERQVLAPANTTAFRRGTIFTAIMCSSAAALTFEIALTRVFAVTQFYHFAFMTVSLALLGFGASGSTLTAFPWLGRGGPRRWAVLALCQSAGTLGAYALANAIPLDSFSIAWDGRQLVYLAASYLALVVPFFFAGLVVGALLSERGLDSHRVYAANLAGSGIGCLFALAGLAWFGGEGVIAASALVAMLAALAFESASRRRSPAFTAVTFGAIVLFAAWTLRPPDSLALRLSPYKDLSAALRYPGAQVLSTRWNASSRVDHVRSQGIRSLPGLSFTYRGSPPPQDGLAFDGDDLSPIPLLTAAVQLRRELLSDAPFVPYLLTSLPFALRPDADVVILEPRGGLDVFVALASSARSIVAVEPNELAVDAARLVYADPRVHTRIDEPRAFVERSPDRFDVIDLALTAPYRPVTSGAYSLAEDYRLTVEAFEQYLSRLKPGGLLAVVRWLQTPPSEETRLIGLAIEAVKRAGGDPARSIVALRGYSTVLALVKQGEFTDEEVAVIRDFAQSRRFDLVAAPGLRPEEANRYNVLPDDAYYRLSASLLSASDPDPVYASYAFDIAPPTDDHPFFGHFFKWAQAPDVLATLGKTWQPFGGAGYFVLVALLGLSAIAAVVLIVAPLVLRSRRPNKGSALNVGGGPIPPAPFPTREGGARDSPHPFPTREGGARGSPPRVGEGSARLRWWTLAYFGLLGIAFLFVEIPIVQQYILLVGRPTTALAVVLFALLTASGLGSLSSRRVPWRAGSIALTVAVALYPSLIRALASAILLAPIEVRLALGWLALLPLGFLMGTMFPKGIAYLKSFEVSGAQVSGDEGWTPWAWGINGATSVISAIASALLALTFGFSFVIACGAVCYGVCSLLVRGARRNEKVSGVR